MSKGGVSCILVLQGHKVTVVILGRPRRFVEADRRHGAPVEAAEVRDVDLGAGPLHRQRGDVANLAIVCLFHVRDAKASALVR